MNNKIIELVKGFILFFLLSVSILTNAQYRALKGDLVTLNLSGYKSGEIYCQFSQDVQNWKDITSINKMDSLIEVNSTGFYRAKVNDCGFIYYSDSLFFKVQEKILSIGVFGGSLSSTPESNFAKNIWLDSLGIRFFNIETKGVGGAGFSSITKNSIPNQIRRAKSYDIYILWASTNDYSYNVPCGDINSTDSTSQNGGINLSINLIRKKNDKALILFFTSIPPFFSTINLNQYIDAQKNLCLDKKIPFLDQYTLSGFTTSNYTNYFYDDAVHLKAEGYKLIGPMQSLFLKTEIFKIF